MVLPSDHLVAFAVTSAVLIAVPGPSVLFAVGRALTIGRRGALLTVAGNAAGAYLQAVAVAFGIGALVQRSAELFTTLKLLGALYLVYLGVQAIRHRRSLGDALVVRAAPSRHRRVLADGVLVGATNPKVLVFFTAALPQFVDRGAGSVTIQILSLGAVFIAIALVSDSVWALAAGTAREWLARSPRRMAALGGAGGLSLIGVGVALAVTGRRD